MEFFSSDHFTNGWSTYIVSNGIFPQTFFSKQFIPQRFFSCWFFRAILSQTIYPSSSQRFFRKWVSTCNSFSNKFPPYVHIHFLLSELSFLIYVLISRFLSLILSLPPQPLSLPESPSSSQPHFGVSPRGSRIDILPNYGLLQRIFFSTKLKVEILLLFHFIFPVWLGQLSIHTIVLPNWNRSGRCMYIQYVFVTELFVCM